MKVENFIDIGVYILAFVVASWSYYNISQFQSLPSPLIGGDYYYQLGQIHYMYSAPIYEWFSTSNGIGERPAYFPIYAIIVTLFGKILHLSPYYALLYSNLVFLPLSVIVFYKLLISIFEDKKMSFYGLLFFVGSMNPFILKYTEFTWILVFPLFLLTYYNFYKKSTKKNSFYLGIMYGILSLSHSTGFIFGSIAMIYLLLYKTIDVDFYKKDIKLTFRKVDKKSLINLFIPIFLGFAIAQIYWFKPLFFYFGKGTKSYLWSLRDYGNIEYQFKFLYDFIKKYIVNLSDLYSAFLSLSFFFGFYHFYREKRYLLLGLFLVLLSLIFSYFITIPLLNMHFLPSYLSHMYASTIIILIASSSLSLLKEKFKIYVMILLILLTGIHLFDLQKNLDENMYVVNAKNNHIFDFYLSLQSYILNNTNYSDVFLSTNEVSFVINALTGRKLMISRRAQNDAFTLDFDQREADAAVIFYGNNLTKRLELIKKYNVRYLYYDDLWVTTEFKNLSSKDNKIIVFDPLMTIDDAKYREQFENNGVIYKRMEFYVDPSVRGEYVRKYLLDIVTYENYETYGYGLWHHEIDDYLIPVWDYKKGNRIVASLYKVDYKKINEKLKG